MNFTVLFPESVPLDGESPSPQSFPSSKRFVILHVEDDENDRFMLERVFKKKKFSNDLLSVRDGQQAIEYLSGKGIYADRNLYPMPGLVLLDLKLPLKNGIEVLEWIRSKPEFHQLLVVILSSSKMPSDVSRAYDLGANSYLVKPSMIEDLVSMFEAFSNNWFLFVQRPSKSDLS